MESYDSTSIAMFTVGVFALWALFSLNHRGYGHAPQTKKQPVDPSQQMVVPLQPFEVGMVSYIALNKPIISLSHQGSTCLATVFRVGAKSVITVKWLLDTIDLFTAVDDVWQKEFLQGLVLVRDSSTETNITAEAKELLERYGMRWTLQISDEDSAHQIPEGPYVVFDGRLLEVCRLYEDDHAAFVTPTIPNQKPNASGFSALWTGTNAVGLLRAAVPSRLYRRSTAENPISGWRIAVKDNHHLEGIRTSVCNKAYYEMYTNAAKTASSIKDLELAGVHIIGSTRLASFAATEEPVQCIDFQAPWNPRGDTYQSPAGSSSGSGAACAAYPWLDVTIGTDTSGSGRRPAHWNGCFGLRPSHSLLSPDGLVRSFPRFDTSTFFTRSIDTAITFTREWYGRKHVLKECKARQNPKIVYPLDYTSLIQDQTQIGIIERFVADLEQFLGIESDRISIEDLWNTNPPDGANGEPFGSYMKDACLNSFFYDDYHNFADFRQEHRKKFGREAYISPPVRWQWNLASEITAQQNQVALERLEVFKTWFLQNIMQPDTTQTIVIVPIENISPRYRDEEPKSHFLPQKVPMLFLSPITKGPEVTIPAGEIPYESKVTGKREYLPMGISLLGVHGEDISLLQMVRDFLNHSKRPSEVSVGRRMFGTE